VELDLRTQGFDEVDAVLKTLQGKFVARELKAAIRKGLNVIRRAARQNIARSLITSPGERAKRGGAGRRRHIEDRTGTLHRGIRTRVRLGHSAILGQVFTSAEAFYGRFLEEGTQFIAARPWLRPALHANQDAVVSESADHLRKSIRKYLP
jgi:HK97 gp10 family phage protein